MTEQNLTTGWIYSQRAQQLTSSAIRELLKVTERPDIISFAGGLPSPQSFPVAEIKKSIDEIFCESANQVLQYSATEGYAPLREWIAQEHSAGGNTIDPARVLITTGSQQALDLLGKVLVDPGSRILVETPTYLGALQAFSLGEPHYVSLPCDSDGLQPERLTQEIIDEARLLYVQPDFQNPTGRQLPLDRRQALARFAKISRCPIIEDSPYSLLGFGNTPLPSVFSMAPEHVVLLGSFSKVLAPGLRVGYVIAPPNLYEKMLQAKQATDLHTPSVTQQIVHNIVSSGFLSHHLQKIRTLYAAQAHAMDAALIKYMPEGVRWNTPQGGMFIWLQLPIDMDSSQLLGAALRRNVAFVPGAPFFATGAGSPDARRSMRLSFATVPIEKMDEGIRRLAMAIKEIAGG